MRIEHRLYRYYLFLLVVLCAWVSTVSAPPMPLRLAFLAALFLPTLFKAPKLLVPAMTCFITIAAYGFSHSYMPTELYYYLGIMTFSILLSLKEFHNTQRPPVILILLCVYVTFIDFITEYKLVNIDYSLIILLLSFFFVSKDGHEKDAYILSFEIISIVLCIYFFIFRQSSTEVMEDGRISWVDPNYMGNVCAMGVVLAYNILINKLFINRKAFSFISIICVILGVIMLVLNASRGAFLSTALAVIVITWFAKIPLRNKVLVACVVVFGVILLYNFGLFELLEERVKNDDGTGNARTIIWATKMEAFFQLPFLKQLFGLGYKGGFDLAILGGYGFHNDYLAFIVEYGYIGFALFITLLLYPITIVKRHSSDRPVIASLIVFLLTCSVTLEPFSAGRLTYWYFYMLIVLFARWSRFNNPMLSK